MQTPQKSTEGCLRRALGRRLAARWQLCTAAWRWGCQPPVRPSSAQPRAVRDTFPCTIAPRDCGVRVTGASGGPAAVGGWALREGECGLTTGDGGCCGGSALREKSAAPHAFSYRVVPHMTPAATHGRPQTDVQSECAAQEATGLPLTTLCQLQTFCTPCSR